MDKDDDEYIGRATCAICMDTQEDAVWVALLCGHVFHLVCYEHCKASTHKMCCPSCKVRH